MTNAIEKMNELLSEWEQAKQAAWDSAEDAIAAMLGEYSDETKAHLKEVENKIKNLKKEYPYEAAYYSVVKKIIGNFHTEDEAKNALNEFSDYICVINGEALK